MVVPVVPTAVLRLAVSVSASPALLVAVGICRALPATSSVVLIAALVAATSASSVSSTAASVSVVHIHFQ